MALLGDVHSTGTDVLPWNDVTEWTRICEDGYLDQLESFSMGAKDARKCSHIKPGVFHDSIMSEDRCEQPLSTLHIPCQDITNDVFETEQLNTYWSEAFEALKQKTAEAVDTQTMTRTIGSHPDFLSLGGNPSPPALPTSSASYMSFDHGNRSNTSCPTAPQTYSLSCGQATGAEQCAAGELSLRYDTTGNTSFSRTSTTSLNHTGFQDTWRKSFSPNPQMSDAGFSSSQTCRTISSSPEWVQQEICGLPSADLPSAASATTNLETPCTSNYHALAKYDPYLLPLVQSLQQAHIHSASEISWLGTELEGKNACSTTLQSMFPQPSGFASSTLPAQTSNYSKSCEYDVNHSYQDQSSAFEVTNWNCPAPSYDRADFPNVGYPAGIKGTVFETTEDHDPVYPMSWNDDPNPNPGNFCLRPTTASSLSSGHTSRPCQLVTPRSNMKSFSMTSYPQFMPFHQRQCPDARHNIAKRAYQLTKPRSSSPPSPSVSISARRAHSSRRSKSLRRAHRHDRCERVGERGGFVNYTSLDHSKILSGVAPSGSYKTKALRDREIERKSKRITQAAVRAVVEAGGDLARLRGEGLLT